MKNISAGVLLVMLGAPNLVTADEDLPKRPDFARYQPMMKRSPFAVATAVAPPPVVSNFAKDFYLANAAKATGEDLVTVTSGADKNLKLYLTNAHPVEGYSISNIEWSDHIGATKVTITKDGQFATIGFNQALVSAPLAANAPNPVMPQPGIPQPQGFGNPAAGMIRPAPIPTLPTPQPRVRTVIPRNPPPVPAPAVEPIEE